MRADLLGEQHADVLTPIRKNFTGVLVSNMAYTPDEASDAIASGKIDAVAFGTSFIANPDLPARIRLAAPLNQPNPATFYSSGPEGYTDYPSIG
jgi:N-ethylmaleimide reductase